MEASVSTIWKTVVRRLWSAARQTMCPRVIVPLAAAAISVGCARVAPEDPGVGKDLAERRSAVLGGLRYGLEFDLTAEPGCVSAHETLNFTASRREAIALDFKAGDASLLSVCANGKSLKPEVAAEHIIIPRRYVVKGNNTLQINFIAGEQPLNRRDGFLFTLLVPDRARTLFPCFDQPDLKAEFTLSLTVPEGWTAVSNTAIASESDGTITFSPTEPLSTYLFSFAAGRFERLEASRGGRKVAMYHRETDPAKVAQAPEIFDLVFDSLDWLEEYTGIPYPFAKYDFVVLPDFQYGGMEHTGATLYNDRRIFLGPDPTTDERLGRASLIAHETSHMWFGDYVTMRWFDDVWTKEVFANWFAARIMRPLFPEVNHNLADMKSCYAPAYAEDRTAGSNAIQRPLGNLQDAGLIYCNIIYDKAPVVMDMLVRKLGWDIFREGIREYLRRFAYSNACWDDLIAILDDLTEDDLAAWSDVWIKGEGMPVYEGRVNGGREEVDLLDPFGKGRRWEQELTCVVAEGRYWLPNVDGKGYGWFKPDPASLGYMMRNWSGFGEDTRMSLLMTLHENSWHGTLDRDGFVRWCCGALPNESNPLIFSSLLSYASSEALRSISGLLPLSETLRSLAADGGKGSELRLQAFRSYFKLAQTEEQWEEIFGIWRERKPFKGLTLGESDYTGMAYQLMISMPERYQDIVRTQRGRITNPDRLEAFDFICRAASPSSAERQALFDGLLAAPEARRPEPRVLTALSLLCHPSRADEALRYIIPSLDALQEIQRTGDIFFPASWCKTLLANQHSAEAGRLVDSYLGSHPEMNPLLVTKVLQARDNGQ